MDNPLILAPSCCPLHSSITQSLEKDVSSESYGQSCPYRKDECTGAGLGLKFRLAERLGTQGLVIFPCLVNLFDWFHCNYVQTCTQKLTLLGRILYYLGDSFGDGQYIDARDPRPCSGRCLCRYHGHTEAHFVFLARKTKTTLDLIIYDASLYFRIVEALGLDIVGSVFSQQGFCVDGFALLRNFEALVEYLQELIQQEQVNHQDAYLVSSMRLLVDGFLGDEEASEVSAIRSFTNNSI